MIWERLIHAVLRWFFDEPRIRDIFTVCYSHLLRHSSYRHGITANLQRISRHSRGRDLSPTELETTLQEMARVQALSLLDDLGDPASWPEQMTLVQPDFLLPLKNLLKRGRGVILVTPHFGSQSRFPALLACRGIPINALYNFASAQQSLVSGYPSLRLFDVGYSALELLRALGRNEVVLTMGDLDYFPDNRTADFFGAPYPPPHGPARLSLASSAPILPVYSVLEGSTWRLISDSPIDPLTTGQAGIEAALLASMERHIARHPSHWLMPSDRWDLPARTAELRRQLKSVRTARGLDSLWKRLRGLGRGP